MSSPRADAEKVPFHWRFLFRIWFDGISWGRGLVVEPGLAQAKKALDRSEHAGRFLNAVLGG